MSTHRPLVALLTGAGISTDSGIPDYRGPNGLWRRDPQAEKLVTYDHYMTDPEIRRRSWRMRLDSPALRARPNEAHHAVVRLERSGVPVRVITQNVDGLHQLAGLPERKVLELHGTVEWVRDHARLSVRHRPGMGVKLDVDPRHLSLLERALVLREPIAVPPDARFS